jgi:hypothetical protein
LLGEVVGRDGDHAEVRSFLLFGSLRKRELTSDQVVSTCAQVLVKNDFVHSLGEVDVDLVEEGSGVRGGLTTETLGVLRHGEDTANLVVVDFGNLVLGHVLNIVVILQESISLDTLVEGGFKPGRKNNGIFFIKENVNTVKTALLLSVLPESVIAFSTRSEFGDLQLAPVAQTVLVTPKPLGINSVLAGMIAPLFGGLELTSTDFLFGLGVEQGVIESFKRQPATEHFLRVAVFDTTGEEKLFNRLLGDFSLSSHLGLLALEGGVGLEGSLFTLLLGFWLVAMGIEAGDL